MFYKSLDEAAHQKAFANDYGRSTSISRVFCAEATTRHVDFDSPDAFDYEILRQCIEDLKACRAAQVDLRLLVRAGR
jgi:hypothetical protein